MRQAALLILFLGAGVVLTCGPLPLGAQESRIASPTPPPESNLALMQSPAWHDTLRAFDEWASVQKLYTPEQVKKYRAQIVEKASNLTGNELEDFLEDLNEKLRVLFSAEAREARKWLSKTLAVASDSYAEKLKAKYPDLAGMTASQMEEYLNEFQDRRASARQGSADFAKARQAQVEMVQAERQRQEEANIRAQSARSYSGYHPAYPSYTPPSSGVQRYTPAYPMPRYGYGGYWGGYRW